MGYNIYNYNEFRGLMCVFVYRTFVVNKRLNPINKRLGLRYNLLVYHKLFTEHRL